MSERFVSLRGKNLILKISCLTECSFELKSKIQLQKDFDTKYLLFSTLIWPRSELMRTYSEILFAKFFPPGSQIRRLILLEILNKRSD